MGDKVTRSVLDADGGRCWEGEWEVDTGPVVGGTLQFAGAGGGGGGGTGKYPVVVVVEGKGVRGREGLGASVCRLLPGVGRVRVEEEVEEDWWLRSVMCVCCVGMPSTRFKRVHSSSRGVAVLYTDLASPPTSEHEPAASCPEWCPVVAPVAPVVVAEREKAEELFLGARRALAALGGNTESFAFSSSGASMGAKGR
jgi:hypothetical protein